jgi:beta-mannosidase
MTTEMEDYKEFFARLLARFIAEEPTCGAACLPSLKKFMTEEDIFHSDEMWQYHTKSNPALQTTLYDTSLRFAESVLGSFASPEDRFFKLRYLQYEWIRLTLEQLRREMWFCSGDVFWMYNDCWPTVRSWTIVDYLRSRTPSFHPVRRAFAPVTVDIAKEADGYAVYGISERLEAKSAVLECGGFTPDGEYITAEMNVTLEANASTKLTVIGNLPEGYIPYAILKADGEVIARRRYIDVRYFELGLEKAEIRTERNGNRVTYTSDRLVLGVCIDLDGSGEFPADNFFDLYPGKPCTVYVGEKCTGEVKYAYMGKK